MTVVELSLVEATTEIFANYLHEPGNLIAAHLIQTLKENTLKEVELILRKKCRVQGFITMYRC